MNKGQLLSVSAKGHDPQGRVDVQGSVSDTGVRLFLYLAQHSFHTAKTTAADPRSPVLP